jgi:1-acyl-sn-glycerol-3-phosphate acyltransferase
MVLRSLVYVAWLYGSMLVLGLAGLPLLALSRRGAFVASRLWAHVAIWGLRTIVGLRVEIRGMEHRPTGAALIAAKHMCMLDTIVPFAVLHDPCFILKQELIHLPVFGWYAKATRMIPVDRAAGSRAVRHISTEASERLQEARQILIFPEGTRRPPCAPPAYKGGVAALYRDLGLACTPMATNSGLFWPPHGFVRRPGLVVFEFLPPIPPGLKRGEFMRTMEERIETASNALIAEAGARQAKV